jgi:hypothetical protein
MKTLQQILIEGLISVPRTAQQLAMDLDLDREAVVEALEEMRFAGVVGTGYGMAPGDAVCMLCSAERQKTDIDETCAAGPEGFECSGPLIDVCLYTYCGGPVSQALALSAQEVAQ